MKFYNVEELCADKIEDFKRLVPAIKTSRLSIGAMYRLTASQILPLDIDRIIYFDSDIIVNLDIKELWQIGLGDKVFAATPEAVINYLDYPFRCKTKFLIVNGFVAPEDYFNSGVLLMNLDYMRNAEELIIEGVKFCGQYPQCDTPDQDILNYLFSKNYLKLPEHFDVFIGIERGRGQRQLRKAIYHYAGSPFGAGMGMDTSEAFNRLWMDCFIKSPWFDSSSIGRLYETARDQARTMTINFSAAMSGKTRTFLLLERDLNAVAKKFSVGEKDEILIVNEEILVQKIIDVMNASRNEKIFFIMLPNFPYQILIQAGFVQNEDFVNGIEFLSEAREVYRFISAM